MNGLALSSYVIHALISLVKASFPDEIRTRITNLTVLTIQVKKIKSFQIENKIRVDT